MNIQPSTINVKHYSQAHQAPQVNVFLRPLRSLREIKIILYNLYYRVDKIILISENLLYLCHQWSIVVKLSTLNIQR